MKFIDTIGAPPELIRVINEEAETCESAKRTVFGAFIPQLQGDMGAFNPEDGTIFIDLGACITKQVWLHCGFTVIANTWLNMLTTAFHELAHAAQLDAEPELITMAELPETYESEATEVAIRSVLNWAMEHKLPRLNELGWAGEEIKKILNELYPKHPEGVLEELKLEGTEIAAHAVQRALTSRDYGTEEEVRKLIKDIDKGEVGAKIDGKFYLTMYEAVGM